MKEEDSNPLEPVGDEPIEARIVAWVLGDASAFEAAELERLCEERPELLVFRRRMQALHGLLSEDEASRPDEAWKLPGEKRAKIEALFGAMHAAPPNVVVAKRFRQPWVRQALMATAACLVLAAGFRYVFAPTSESGAKISNRTFAMAIQKDEVSERMTPRTRAIAEGYASSQPVLPPIADLESTMPAMPGLQSRTEFASGLGSGGGRGGAFGPGADSDALAKNENTLSESAERKKGAKAPAKPAAASSLRAAEKALGSGLASSAPTPTPAAAPPPSRPIGGVMPESAPAAPAAKPAEFSRSLATDGAAAIAKNDRAGIISPVDGAVISGVPAASGADVTNIITGGLRSGDGAITRNNIDAVLNNPNRVAQSEVGPREDIPSQMRDSGNKGDLAKTESGGVEGELHIGYSSDYIFRDSGEASKDAADVAKTMKDADAKPADAFAFNVQDEGTKAKATPAEKQAAQAWAGEDKSGNIYNANKSDRSSLTANGAAETERLGLADIAAQATPAPRITKQLEDTSLAKDADSPTDPFSSGEPADRPRLAPNPPAAPATPASGKPEDEQRQTAAAPYGASVAQREMVRRQEAVAAGDQLLIAGREAYARGDHQGAVDKYKQAIDRLPNAPATEERLKSYKEHLADGNVALAMDYEKQGKIEEARKVLDELVSSDPENLDARRMQAHLKDPIHNDPALAAEHAQNVEKVRKGLYLTEGNYNLGKYDEAKKEAENVLRIDPYNSAARRMMERINNANSDYYRAAYDHSKAELLMQTDRAWELAVPAQPEARSVESLKREIREQEVEIAKTQGLDSALERSVDSTDYAQAKRELEKSQEQLAALKARNREAMAKMKSSPKAADDATATTFSHELQVQEDRVEEKRKLLTNILRAKQIILTGQESIYRSDINEDDRGAVSARDTANKLEQEKVQLESQIQTLQKYDNDQLLSYAAGLNLPENVLKTVYPQYLEQQRALGKLKAEGLADSHPTVQAQAQALAKTKRQLDDGVTSLRETLTAQYKVADDRLAKVKVLSEDATQLQRAKLANLKKQLEIAEAASAAAQPKPAPVPVDETVAAAEPFSTFSLHVSDASFKLAKAALDRGERLSADQIRTEEFYNAFDYGDPAPAPGEPVACTIEQAAHPVLPQRNLVRVAMRVGSAGRGQGQPLNLTLLLDNSGSMERDDRHEGLKAAIGQLASLLQPGDTVTLAGFSRTPHLLADRLSGAEAAKLVELVDKLPSEGGTNLEEALKLAGELAIQRKNPAAQNRIVLLTDGAANLGNAQPEDLAQKVAALRQQGIAFDAAGIGAGGLNDRMLEALTRHGNGRYYIVNDPKDADANFAKQLAGAFRPAAENVKVQVHFNPDRVSRYKLIGFEKHRLNTEDFRNDAVDAAELAADEAGVALYQVETIPGGTGEIGEVSVRFRDTASGRMVENTWTVPHDEKTPAFDQARPSIQLATLAMLAAEKLRGGPLADATDFTTLAPVISRVKTYYSTSSRVGELTGMTGKLR
ncbi:von Willebrand factor type A domain-containing protein [Luteolibacter sp. LG18]|uniref:YfbK domain-containing protein n=1 Tax=Luteolibacter sp. LG18 TaxID=2819286 RepID=UPI002B31F372|nr:hypothetical protein llg_09000 [Luteolibacter sp. LG18]